MSTRNKVTDSSTSLYCKFNYTLAMKSSKWINKSRLPQSSLPRVGPTLVGFEITAICSGSTLIIVSVVQIVFFFVQFSFNSQDDIMPPFPLKLPVTEDGLTAETGIIIRSFTWNRCIIYPTSHHYKPPLNGRIENN